MLDAIRSRLFPIFATRAEHRWHVARHLALLAMLASIVWSLLQGRVFHAPFPVIVAIFASMAVYLAITKYLEELHHRALRKLRDAAFLCCPTCRYSLNKSIRAGRCPECGNEFDLDSLRRAWVGRYLNHLRRVETREHDRVPDDDIDLP